jgi:probable HAF family extracellular repeat protein
MMKRNLAATISATILVAGLMLATRLTAQDQSATMGRKSHHRYKLIDLGTFGGANSSTNGSSVVINEEGTVVGGAETDMPCPYLPEFPIGPAFKWERGVMTELPRLPGGCFGFAIAINSEGTIVGSADDGVLDPLTGEPEIRAVVWKDGQIIDLGTFGGANSLATNINPQ